MMSQYSGKQQVQNVCIIKWVGSLTLSAAVLRARGNDKISPLSKQPNKWFHIVAWSNNTSLKSAQPRAFVTVFESQTIGIMLLLRTAFVRQRWIKKISSTAVVLLLSSHRYYAYRYSSVYAALFGRKNQTDYIHWRRANARNVGLYYPYWQYTDLFIFRFVSLLCLRRTLRLCTFIYSTRCILIEVVCFLEGWQISEEGDIFPRKYVPGGRFFWGGPGAYLLGHRHWWHPNRIFSLPTKKKRKDTGYELDSFNTLVNHMHEEITYTNKSHAPGHSKSAWLTAMCK